MNVDELPSMVERAISQSRLGLPPGGLQRANSSQGSGLDGGSSVGGSSRGKNLLRAGSSTSVAGVGAVSGGSLNQSPGTQSWKLGEREFVLLLQSYYLKNKISGCLPTAHGEAHRILYVRKTV
jgi:hypothetical protein